MTITFDWQATFADKITTPEDAVASIKHGNRVFVGSGAAEPQTLVAALVRRRHDLAGAEVIHIMTLGVAPYVDAKFHEGFRHNAFFIGANTREAVADCRADYTPIFLSELPRLIREGRRGPIDVALIQTSPPDKFGFMSYGVSVDIVKAAAESACRVVAQVNSRMPRVLGDSFIHVSQVHALVPVEEPLLEAKHPAPDEVAQRIGQRIADLIEDGSTLQMGIGTIPDAVLACLTDKKDLGIHTEMFSDGVIPLVEAGVINGRRKNIRPGKIVSSFVLGSHRLYDWLHDNPMVEFHPTEYTNDPFRIAQHDKMIAINSALEVDLTGQVCADSLGTYFYSGIGGQVDFIRGASRSHGGKPIIALPATAKHGAQSRIVSALKPGAGVVTSRGDVHYVVTEFGVADLHGKSIRERVLALVHIAHPDFRDQLMEEARQRRLVPQDQVAVRTAGTPEIESLTTRFTTPEGETVLLRPVHPTDEEALRDAFYHLSPETLHQRFHGVVKSASRKRFRDVTIIDPDKGMVIVGVHHEGERDVIVATARYEILPASGEAVAGILVADEWQGKGIGTRLLQHLMEIARGHRVPAFIASVFPDNKAVLHVFHKCALAPIHSSVEDGVYHLRIPLNPEPAPARTSHAE